MKSSPSSIAPLQSLSLSAECWESVSMALFSWFSEDAYKNNGIRVFVDRSSKIVHLAAIPSQSMHTNVRVASSTQSFASIAYQASWS